MHGSALNEARSASSLKRRFAQYLVYPLERLSAILAKRVLAVGPDAASIYATPYLVGNGVDTDLFKPDIKTSNPTILFVGTWEGRKRGKFLFELFTKKVLPILPQARLTMVSDTCDEHPSVDFVKFPSDEVLATLYGKAWVFAYPSLYEGFGIAYLEAMASGTAVIATKNPGAEYVLDSGRYAIISEDISFGSDLIELLSNEELRSGYVEQGILRAQEFTWKAIAENHCVHYREILGNSKS